MPDLIMKQVIAVVDQRTTMVCLRAAGQIQPLDKPFDTLMGPYDAPPFHISCRSVVGTYMAGFVQDQRVQANAEIKARPAKEKRHGPDGYAGRLPPPPPTSAMRAESRKIRAERRDVQVRVNKAMRSIRVSDLPKDRQAEAVAWVKANRPRTFSSLPKWIQKAVRGEEGRKTT